MLHSFSNRQFDCHQRKFSYSSYAWLEERSQARAPSWFQKDKNALRWRLFHSMCWRFQQSMAETFSHWGVATLGMLAMLPEKDLIGRLGQEGRRLRQLARGEHPHLFLPIEPVIRLEEYIELDTPVEVLDSLLFGIGLMIDQLITRVRERILSLAAITAELGMEGGGVHDPHGAPRRFPRLRNSYGSSSCHLDLIAPFTTGSRVIDETQSGDRRCQQDSTGFVFAATAGARPFGCYSRPHPCHCRRKTVAAALN